MQQEADRALFGRQAGLPGDLVTGSQVALAGQIDLIQLQGIGQVGRRFEGIGGDTHPGRQVFGQWFELARQAAIEIAAAVAFKVQGLEHITLDRQRHLPRLLGDFRQAQLPLGVHRPIACRLHGTLEVEAQVITLKFQPIDLQPCCRPVGIKLQVTQLRAAVEVQAADTHIGQFDRQGQFQRRQLQRPTVGGVGCRGKLQFYFFHMQLLDAQGLAQQTPWRPGEHRRQHANPIGALLPEQARGLPLPAQSALKILYLQARHLRQCPAAAGLGAQQQPDGYHHNQQEA
ncbi:hypothetical protein D3C81_1428440 [compost metagenome]